MKKANLRKSPNVHSNIIVFPGSLAPHPPPARPPAAKETAITRPDLHIWRDPGNLRDLFAATRDILARRHDLGELTKVRQLNFSRRIPRGIRIPQASTPAPIHGIMKHPTAESRMKMLLDLKRDEKPPVNFLRDFLTEFQRRNYGSEVRTEPSRRTSWDKPTG